VTTTAVRRLKGQPDRWRRSVQRAEDAQVQRRAEAIRRMVADQPVLLIDPAAGFRRVGEQLADAQAQMQRGAEQLGRQINAMFDRLSDVRIEAREARR
jgi:hypothetical protein